MSTLLVDVETVINLHPLTYVYSENNEPMHFLNIGKEITYPIIFVNLIKRASKRLSALRQKYQSLWLKQL